MKLARVLCVDDEPKVLEGITRLLHRKYTLLVAQSGEEALQILGGPEPIDIIVSDMRMGGMSGAALLAECRHRSPDTVRLLLTGHSDLDAAISAVNDGHIFRFLTKPCAQPVFMQALIAAAEQRRLVMSERVLLEQTLVGSVRALTEVLGLVHPEAFGSSARQHERARNVAAHLQVTNAWHVEVASMLSHVGYVALPNDLLVKLQRGSALDAIERGMMARVPEVIERVLSLIPRLELVQEILKHQTSAFVGNDERGLVSQQAIPVGSRILKALSDLAIEETRSPNVAVALAILRTRRAQYDPAVLDAIAVVCAPHAPETREVCLREIKVGMVLASDVFTKGSVLLVARGHPVTAQLVARLRNFDIKFGVVQPILCSVATASEATKPPQS
jgi:response regulator RpfG family c-di-GMP phosphodiesterase